MTSISTTIPNTSTVPADICTGTSGYNYSAWRNGVFFPKGLKHADELRHYSGVLSCCEINTTFHGIPREETFEKWYKNTKNGFTFALKVPSEITHEKKLDDIDDVFEFFITRAQSTLKDKLGPVLFQLPPSMQKDIPKLKETCKLATRFVCKFAFEFRDKSWYCDTVFDILKQYNAAICENFSPDGHTVQTQQVTADWCYSRFHKNVLHEETNYSDAKLTEAATHIVGRHRQRLKQYLFFMNDLGGFGPKNAKQLVSILGKDVANPTPIGWKADKVIQKGGAGSIGGMFAKMKKAKPNPTTPPPSSMAANLLMGFSSAKVDEFKNSATITPSGTSKMILSSTGIPMKTTVSFNGAKPFNMPPIVPPNMPTISPLNALSSSPSTTTATSNKRSQDEAFLQIPTPTASSSSSSSSTSTSTSTSNLSPSPLKKLKPDPKIKSPVKKNNLTNFFKPKPK